MFSVENQPNTVVADGRKACKQNTQLFPCTPSGVDQQPRNAPRSFHTGST